MSHRRITVFFYGLFMDREVLLAKGLQPSEPRLVSPIGIRKPGMIGVMEPVLGVENGHP